MHNDQKVVAAAKLAKKAPLLPTQAPAQATAACLGVKIPAPCRHQPAEWEPIAFFNSLDWY